MLPKKLSNFTIFYEGSPLTGVAEEITLPVLERATEDYRGAGMLGPVKLDLGMNGLSLDFTLAEFTGAVFDTWGISNASGAGLRFLGAAQSDDAAGADAIEISVRGRPNKIEPGTAKAGEMTKPKVEMALTYFKYSVNGTVKHEIDLINGKEIAGGVNRTAATLKALGLAS